MDEKQKQARIERLEKYLSMLYKVHYQVPKQVKSAINDRIELIKKGEV